MSIFEVTGGTRVGTLDPYTSVEQPTPNKNQTVEINARSGTIITQDSTLLNEHVASFEVKNSFVKRGDMVLLSFEERFADDPDSPYTHENRYSIQTCVVRDGSFRIQIHEIENVEASRQDNIYINFTILKAVDFS